MACVTYFIATSSSGKELSKEELSAFINDLLEDEFVFLPAAILVGEARNEVRTDEDDTTIVPVNLDGRQYIIPNAPDNMLYVVEKFSEEDYPSADTLWFYGDDEQAFFEALDHMPFQEKDICICFPYLDENLQYHWNKGAAIYALTRPFATDFIDPIGTEACPLIDYDVAQFFALCSHYGGTFPSVIDNPLHPLFLRYFGPDLEMQQT